MPTGSDTQQSPFEFFEPFVELVCTMPPRIKIESSISSPVLDLESDDPVHLTLTMTLDHTGPITLCNKYLGFLTIKVMGNGGLTFTDVATGELSKRPDIMVLWLFTNEFFEKNPELFTTLRPGEPHPVVVTMEPHGVVDLTAEGLTTTTNEQEYDDDDDYYSGRSTETYTRYSKWTNTKGLEGGKTYRVGTHQKEMDEDWIEGTTEELMARSEEQILADIEKVKAVIPFDYGDMAEFSVKRPDTNFKLSYS